jgi:hypothetical protein
MKSLALWMLLVAPAAAADKVWWSFPGDDDSAIEVDEADAHASDFEELPPLVAAVKKCNIKKGAALLKKRDSGDGTPLRELRIDERRCVLTLPGARKLLGKRLVERLDDELDAHVSFLQPRKFPGGVARPTPTDGGAVP